MTEIHMNISAARRVQRDIIRLRESIQRIVQKSNSSTNAMFYGHKPAWRGDSASEFQGLYQDSISNITGILGPLGEIASEIEEAIEYWESVARRLSD
jgi:uncharacterized protein YukE